MIDLSCNYLGIKLKSPLIAGSSGLTSSVENLRQFASMGAGAVVLKSVFEEQIKYETEALLGSEHPEIEPWTKAFNNIVNSSEYYYGEAFNYLTDYAREHTLKKYLSFISDAKMAIDIPVIASINCTTQYDWQYFARRIQEAGADALELNIYVLPSDTSKNSTEIEGIYFDTVREVLKYVTIPVSVKTGYYFSNLAGTLQKLSETGISGLTLFNRPYNPDIDIDNLGTAATNIFSNENEYSNTLRWVALLAGRLRCDIAASTGIHDHRAVIKQLLAGADVVQMVSVFYLHTIDFMADIKAGLEEWMKEHNFNSLTDFKGYLSQKNIKNPSSYERVQFIRLFTGIE